MDYFAPKHLIIGTNKFDKNSEETQIYTFDGNAAKLPTEIISDHYEKVHISESLEDYYNQFDYEKAFNEMSQLERNECNMFHNAEESGYQQGINTLKD